MAGEPHVWDGLGLLAGAQTGWDDEAVDQYGAHLECPDPEAFTAAVDHLLHSWAELARPSIAVIEAAYRDELAKRPALPTVNNIHCDGTGWKRGPDGYEPCPRCNPALWLAREQPAAWDAYLSGTSLADLDVGAEAVKGVLRWRSGTPPVRCRSADELPAKPGVGPERAVEAYEAECREQGREPSDLTDVGTRLFARPT